MEIGSVLHINISNGGVPKRSIQDALVTPLGIEGDIQAHPQFHGGPTQALLLITSEGIEELKAAGFPLYPGALGENITSRGLNRHEMRLGQRWRIGEIVIELTKIRVPCSQIQIYGAGIQRAVYDQSVKAGDWSSPRWGLSGFYASVIQPGSIHVGDEIAPLDSVV